MDARLVRVAVILIYFLEKREANQDVKCGRPLGSKVIIPSERIVSGYDIGYYRYPWYAALIQKNQVSCGGALIGPKTVITAAHCYKEYLDLANTSNLKLEHIYTVRLGMYNICQSEKTMTEYTVAKVQVHELYPKKKPYYDICLLTLKNETDKYEPLCLPSGIITLRPKEGTVPGMGSLRYQGPMPCTIHEARLLIYPDNTCVKMMNSTGNNGSEITNAFCAGYLSGGIDTCQGDSGGPLQIVNEDGQYILFGIVSFGFHCAVPGYLGLYTDVSKYIGWIKDQTQSDLQFISSLTSNNQDESNESQQSDDHKKKKKSPFHAIHQHRSPITIIILKNSKSEHRIKMNRATKS